MRERNSIAIALVVSFIAILANGAGMVLALSMTARPAALGLGVAGLLVAGGGLAATLIWACRKPAPLPCFDDGPDVILGPPLLVENAYAPLPAPPRPPVNDNVVILADWLGRHR